MSQTEWENLASLLSLSVAIVAGIIFGIGLVPHRWIDRGETVFVRASKTPAVWYLLLAAFSFAVNCSVALRNGIPRPIIHDEFSYLLAADTFAQGRLTNPTPPFFEHFETPHELMKPTYMSKYPPGQGIALAIGQITCNLPIVGIWLATALAVAAIYWMLLGYLSPPWALLGGLVAVTSPALVDWSQVYWGGSLAVLGGALVTGAWGRLMIRASSSSSLALGIGLVVLANCRPFEGLLASVPLLIALAIHRRRGLIRTLVPCAIVLGLGAVWMGYYNFRVTGHVLRLPFQEYTRQYDVYPKFWFLPRRPVPIYGNRSQKWVHTDFEKGQYDQLRTPSGFVHISILRTAGFVNANLKSAALLLPWAIGFLLLLRDLRLRWISLASVTMGVGLCAENFDLPHYSAPILPGLLLLTIAGWSWLGRVRWRGRAIGRALVPAIGIGYLAGAGMCQGQGVSADSRIVEQQLLVALEPALRHGRHLIFVEYSPLAELSSAFANEYVFNAADLPGSPIIWARSFGPASDLPVAHYFSGREVWLLTVGGKLDLQPYPGVDGAGQTGSGNP